MTSRMRDQSGLSMIELLIVILLLGVVGTAIFGILFTSNRAYTFSSDVREVMDDGRISLERIRRELRAGRRVYTASNAAALHFWVDQNQDAIEQPQEQICYVVRSVEADRWELTRWTVDLASCSAAAPAGARTIAATLRSADVFTYDCGGGTPCPPTDPASNDVVREVTIGFQLDVRSASGPDILPVSATVRLRNVA